MFKKITIITFISVLTACGNDGPKEIEIPEVNKENCNPTNINSLKELETRDAMRKACRKIGDEGFRGGKVEKSSGKSW